MLIALTGLHGSGKTTMAFELERIGCAIRLRPFTTREKRIGEQNEYCFPSDAEVQSANILWSYSKSGTLYGMTAAEAARIPTGGIGVVSIHTEGLAALRNAVIVAEVMIVGLDTIGSEPEQFERIGRIPTRAQTSIQILETRRMLRALPVCYDGDQSAMIAKLVALTLRGEGRANSVANRSTV
jgi:guanylate kinase